MRWTSRSSRIAAAALAALLATLVLGRWATSAEDKRLSVNVDNGAYFVPVLDKEGHEYVSLRELLQPLGQVEVQLRGGKARIRTHGRELEVEHGSGSAELEGKRIALAAPALIERETVLVPFSNLALILNGLLKTRVELNHNTRRIFLGNAGVRFTAEISRAGDSSVLRLSFSAPVNPTISTETGKLRLAFQRDPVASGVGSFRFEDRLIPGANFVEANGLATLEVHGTAPLLAEFAEGGRVITVTAAPGPQTSATATPPPSTAPAEPPVASPMAPLPMPAPDVPAAAAATPVHARYLVVIDASHGGNERGAALTPDLAEKDVTLAFARRLRQELRDRGIATLMMREADLTIPLEHRAETVNVAHAAVYISIHASTPGPGLRVYTSMLDPAPHPGPFVPWERAQAPHAESSRKLVEVISSTLERRRLAVSYMPAPVRPLNSIAAAAVAVELSPPRAEPESILNSNYQGNLAGALASAIAAARPQVEAAR